MRREDCVEMFERIPEQYHPYVNVVMRNQAVVAVDLAVRFEPTYVLLRGREGGSTDEGRAFFIPYEEIAYLRIDRVLRLSQLKQMFGEAGFVDDEDKLAPQTEAETADAQAKAALADIPTPTPTAIPMPSDPAAIAKQNLLDRIRAARANAGGATGKLSGK
jgi:hypothetical protein